MKLHRLLSFIFLVSSFFVKFPSDAQDLKLKHVEFKDNKLVIYYSLADSMIGRFYTVRLYASKDNFLNPLEKVTGDIGLEVKPGAENKIIWDIREELGTSFDGRISLEIRGRYFVPFINTESISQYKTFKRKRKYDITWTGGTPQNILNFDLYNGEEKIFTYPNIANVGNYSLEFPVHIRPKKNYRFRISDTKNNEDVVNTSAFTIKRKVPLLMKAVPLLLFGSLIYKVLQSNTGDPDLPRPILPQ